MRLREDHFRRRLRKALGLRRGMSDAAMLEEMRLRLLQALALSIKPGSRIHPQVEVALKRFVGPEMTLQQAVLLSDELDKLMPKRSALPTPAGPIAAGIRDHRKAGPITLTEPLEAIRDTLPTGA